MVRQVAVWSLVVGLGVARASTWPDLELAWSVEGDQEEAWFGSSVASAGDVDGDGYDDVLVGAHRYDDVGGNDEGRVELYLGSPSGAEKTPAWTKVGDQEWGNFGISVASAGDVNGDGFADVIVGATLYDDGEADEGKAFLYLGSESGLESEASWTAGGDQNVAGFGKSVASAGDVNGDGFGDVIVGANFYDGDEDSEGMAFVYHGSTDGLSKLHAWSSAGPAQGYAQFGVSVASAGDVNGDGYDDVIVGCLNYENGSDEEGGAFVFLGSGSGLELEASWIAEPDQEYTQFGISVASAGDVNGDGYDEVIVGAPAYDDFATDDGAAFLFHGSSTGLAAKGSAVVSSVGWGQALANRGTSVAPAGDVDDDGFDDLIVGVPYYDALDWSDGGGAFVSFGLPGGGSSSWALSLGHDDAAFGWSVSSAGDVNGDGFADVIIGANKFDDEDINEGRALVFHGGVQPGWGDDGTGDDGGGDDSGLDDTGAGDGGGGDDAGGDDSGGGDVGDQASGDGSEGGDGPDSGCGCGGGIGRSVYAVLLLVAAITRRCNSVPYQR
jgi:hypothetical protein